MNKSTAYFTGFRLIETTALKKKVPRRTHRKRRINKKWLKRYGYRTVLDDGRIIRYGDCLFTTPKTVKKIIATMRQ